MDFAADFTVFQGFMTSLHKTCDYSKISARGGNEEKIKCLLMHFMKFYNDQKCITEKEIPESTMKVIRKFSLYVILNTEVSVLDQFADMEGMDTVVRSVPTITKCLMCEIFWNLHPQNIVYETIAYCCPQLSVELTEAFIDSIRYFTPMESLDKLKLISAACYKFICRLHFYNFEKDAMNSMLKSSFNRFQKCLNYFIDPPNIEKLHKLSTDEQYKYRGDCLRAMLLLIQECLNEFTSEEVSDFDEIYLFTYKDKGFLNNKLNYIICDSPNKCILEYLNKCNMLLLDKCKELVMDVSVDIFCAWSEFEENGETMQKTIGDICYKLHTKLLSFNELSEHPLVNMIEQIEHKPDNHKDIINSTDNSSIIEKIHNDDGKKALWISALVYKENICHNKDLLKELAANLDVLNNEELYTLFKICCSHLESDNTENKNNVLIIANEVFQYCNFTTKLKILEEHFSQKCFTDVMKVSNFDDMTTEIFNKLITSPIADLSDVLSVFLQSPEGVYKKIFSLAIENTQQTDIMLKIMRLLDDYSTHCYSRDIEPCVIKVMKTIIDRYLNTGVKEKNFVNFVCGLRNDNIISVVNLLLAVIMPKLTESLKYNIFKSNVLIQILRKAFALEELIKYRAPILVILWQIIEVLRIKCFSAFLNIEGSLENALQLQKLLFNTYETNIPENEANWLKLKIYAINIMNKFYYWKLWTLSQSTYFESVAGENPEHMDNNRLELNLMFIMSHGIQEEWCEVWDNMTVFGDMEAFDIIFNSFRRLCEKSMTNRYYWSFLKNYYKKFIYITRYKFLKTPITNDRLPKVLETLTYMQTFVDEEFYEYVADIYMPLLAYISERRNDYTFNAKEYLLIKSRYVNFISRVDQMFSPSSNGAM